MEFVRTILEFAVLGVLITISMHIVGFVAMTIGYAIYGLAVGLKRLSKLRIGIKNVSS